MGKEKLSNKRKKKTSGASGEGNFINYQAKDKGPGGGQAFF